MKEFCLKDERKELYEKICGNLCEGYPLKKIFIEIAEQDKDFIKILKEDVSYGRDEDIIIKVTPRELWNIIDKLTGDL